MTGRPGTARVARLRAAAADETAAIQAVWEASLAADDPAAYPRGGWSVQGWATDTRVLVLGERVIGVAAVRGEVSESGGVPIRVALDVPAREPEHAERLVRAALDMARATGARSARLWVPSRAGWTQAAARQAGFGPVRTVAHMLLPAGAPTPTSPVVPGLVIRSIRDGEEEAVLAALNRAWAGTWEFVPIRPEMLRRDLEGQRDGMLVGFIDGREQIVATCHAVFESTEQNPDGHPRAWISNLTVDPGQRTRGLGRAMLAAAIQHLRERGGRSVTLGVDAGNPAPMRLYRSAGFVVASTVEAWDRTLE